MEGKILSLPTNDSGGVEVERKMMMTILILLSLKRRR